MARQKILQAEPKKSSSPEPWSERGLKVFAALPFRMARQKIGYLQRNGLGAEIFFYDTNWICNFPSDKVCEVGKELRDAGIEVIVHGPIHDLNLGSLDAVIRDYSRHCFLKTLALCHALGAKSVVLHLGVNPLLPEGALSGWLEGSIRAWEPIVDMAEQLKMTIRLENMFIPSPRFIVELKKGLKSDIVQVCFDIGHYNIYSTTPLSLWMDEMGTDITEVHLNDNMGGDDEHFALGKGEIDFKRFLQELAAVGAKPDFTLEMTNDKFDESLEYLDRNNLLAPFENGRG